MFFLRCSPLPGFLTLIAYSPHTAPTENVNMYVEFLLPNAGKKYASPTPPECPCDASFPVCLPLKWHGQAHSLVLSLIVMLLLTLAL